MVCSKCTIYIRNSEVTTARQLPLKCQYSKRNCKNFFFKEGRVSQQSERYPPWFVLGSPTPPALSLAVFSSVSR